eukprot:XP_019074666.1 PREDICTED: metacaspase-1 isoform X1 [Vitis vinifera]
MSHSHQAPEVYPPPPSTAYPSSGPYVAPPPAGYPMKDAPNPQNPPPVETKSRGEGFWKGWYVETGNLYIFLSDIQLVALKGQNHTCLNFSNFKKKKPNNNSYLSKHMVIYELGSF